jgi:hypothetical protein
VAAAELRLAALAEALEPLQALADLRPALAAHPQVLADRLQALVDLRLALEDRAKRLDLKQENVS